MPTYKDECPKCGGEKDKRAKMCSPCRHKYAPSRLNTGKGFVKSSCGYMYGCFNGKRIYEHRKVMEDFLGRELKRNEHVHHIDGDKTNNDISNLELMNASDHHRMHIEPIKFEMSKKGHAARWGNK